MPGSRVCVPLVPIAVLKGFFEAQEKQEQLRKQLEIQKQLGADTAKIEELQRMLSDQNAKVAALAAQKEAQAAAPPAPAAAPEAPAAPSEAMMKMQLEMIQQQKELELIKQGKL